MAAKPPKKCCGCSRHISAVETWCNPCHLRLPTGVRATVEDADRTLRAAIADGVVWLQTHPHATDRELDIIAGASRGLENQHIAEELSLSLHTVRWYWRDLQRRWGCTNRAHVVATAYRLGYLQVADGPERKKPS